MGARMNGQRAKPRQVLLLGVRQHLHHSGPISLASVKMQNSKELCPFKQAVQKLSPTAWLPRQTVLAAEPSFLKSPLNTERRGTAKPGCASSRQLKA